MKQRRWLIPGSATAALAVLCLLVWVLIRPVPAESRESNFAGLEAIDALVLSVPGPGDPCPRVAIEEPEHDFGVMDLGDVGEHAFIIRNDGDAPLELRKGPTTCRCTLSNLVNEAVPPQSEGEVRLSWEPQIGGVEVRQSATIYTNDPDRREIKLVVVGKVVAFATAFPSPLLFPDVPPGGSATRRALVYSQAWDHFEIAGIDAAGAEMSWEVEAAPQEILEKIGAKAGYAVDVTVAPGMPAGDFGGELRINVAFPRHPEAGEVSPVRLNVAGKVLGSIAIYHPRIRKGRLDLGHWAWGEAFKETFPVYFRGEHVGREIVELRAEPGFVLLRQVHHEAISDQLAVHTLELEVPATARPSEYVGQIVVVTDHPTNPEVRMPLRFVVTATGSKRSSPPATPAVETP